MPNNSCFLHLSSFTGWLTQSRLYLQTLDRYGATNEAKKQALFAQAAQADKLLPIAEHLGCSLANLSLAWVISNPDVSTAIFGASSVEQVYDNLKAIEVRDKLCAPGQSDDVNRSHNYRCSSVPTVVTQCSHHHVACAGALRLWHKSTRRLEPSQI